MRHVHGWRYFLAVCTLLTAGCGSSMTADPPSNAPELAGRWEVLGDRGGAYGDLILDSSGDPIRLEDHPQLQDIFGERRIFIDGRPHSTNAGLDYVAIGSASISAGDVNLALELDVSLAGIKFGSSTVRMTGRLISEDLISGTLQITQDLPGYVNIYSEPGVGIRAGD